LLAELDIDEETQAVLRANPGVGPLDVGDRGQVAEGLPPGLESGHTSRGGKAEVDDFGAGAALGTPATATQPVQAAEPSEAAESGGSGEVQATDAAKREAQERGVNLSEVEGTGSGGNITVDDVKAHADKSS
jgi:pyruvate/2-oxoglutarate dehydrogenase complex dihydrolipoamide acyltransferase (E2) component